MWPSVSQRSFSSISSYESLLSHLSSVDPGVEYVETEEREAKEVQLTLAIIKPTAMKHHRKIEKIIMEEGFTTVKKRMVHLTHEQSSDFYIEHYGKTYFPKVCVALSQAPIIVMCLAKYNAVEDWRKLIGPPNVDEAKRLCPFSLRALYGSPEDNELNGLHGSQTPLRALADIRFFFPTIIMEPTRAEDESVNYLNQHLIPTLTKGIIELCKKKPADPMIWLSDWLLMNNPYQPKLPDEILQIPT